MEKNELIKEYKNYCIDLNTKEKSKKNINAFIYDYIIFLYNNSKITMQGIEQEQEKAKKILYDFIK